MNSTKLTKVFIDGGEGTTGLRINARLTAREDIEVITLADEVRKDPAARQEALCSCDIAMLCLPDAAARQAIELIDCPEGKHVRVIDASTAHRTNPDWTYGFPELPGHSAEEVAASMRVAVPGCHASGYIALVLPLIRAGILPSDAALTCTSLTGYSGGGKKMIANYLESGRSPLLSAPRIYALGQSHKHLPEMVKYSENNVAPVFLPIVGNFYSGMLVTVPLHAEMLGGAKLSDITDLFRETYNNRMVRYVAAADEDGFLSAAALSGRDSMEISVFGSDDRILLAARYDNLGKGASGAALECLNLMCGADPYEGLVL